MEMMEPKKVKLDKNTTRSLDMTVGKSPFKARSLTLEEREWVLLNISAQGSYTET